MASSRGCTCLRGRNHPDVMLCVFPVLFLKALALVGGAGESKTRQQAHGMAYSAGIPCSFWIIAGALLRLRALGKQAVWGFQLQSPGFVVAMTCLLFFMALSLAGMFDLGMTLTSAGDSLARKGGLPARSSPASSQRSLRHPAQRRSWEQPSGSRYLKGHSLPSPYSRLSLLAWHYPISR